MKCQATDLRMRKAVHSIGKEEHANPKARPACRAQITEPIFTLGHLETARTFTKGATNKMLCAPTAFLPPPSLPAPALSAQWFSAAQSQLFRRSSHQPSDQPLGRVHELTVAICSWLLLNLVDTLLPEPRASSVTRYSHGRRFLCLSVSRAQRQDPRRPRLAGLGWPAAACMVYRQLYSYSTYAGGCCFDLQG